ncbi:MAG: IgA receptor [Rhizobium sp.]|nr:IgA receptor [Rhizobium sp.]
MAQPNVVREPSMDEILASIRRIIESNDPVPQPGLATGMAEPEGFSGDAANDDTEEVPLTVDEIFAQQQEADARLARETYEDRLQEPDLDEAQPLHAPEQPPAQPPKSLSLADVAARVRAASERNPGLRELTSKPAEPAQEATSPLMTSPLTSSMTLAGGASASVEAVAAPEPAWIVPVTEEHLEIGEDLMPAPEVVEEMIAAPSLISAGTGQQVARAFQDLAAAVDSAERRSFDEIAEDLLRPMLQDWLDDNLPTLVERLVREEIERVARGPRR